MKNFKLDFFWSPCTYTCLLVRLQSDVSTVFFVSPVFFEFFFSSLDFILFFCCYLTLFCEVIRNKNGTHFEERPTIFIYKKVFIEEI